VLQCVALFFFAFSRRLMLLLVCVAGCVAVCVAVSVAVSVAACCSMMQCVTV